MKLANDEHIERDDRPVNDWHRDLENEEPAEEPIPRMVEQDRLTDKERLIREFAKAQAEIGKWGNKADVLEQKLPTLRGKKRGDTERQIHEYREREKEARRLCSSYLQTAQRITQVPEESRQAVRDRKSVV